MGIEIDKTPNLGVSESHSNKRAENETVEKNAQGPAAQANTNASDSVHLTTSARQLAALENRLDKVPEVDSNRVDKIKRAIADGTYEVNAERIATKLTNLEALLPR